MKWYCMKSGQFPAVVVETEAGVLRPIMMFSNLNQVVLVPNVSSHQHSQSERYSDDGVSVVVNRAPV